VAATTVAAAAPACFCYHVLGLLVLLARSDTACDVYCMLFVWEHSMLGCCCCCLFLSLALLFTHSRCMCACICLLLQLVAVSDVAAQGTSRIGDLEVSLARAKKAAGESSSLRDKIKVS
jgi:hypothetical protein